MELYGYAGSSFGSLRSIATKDQRVKEYNFQKCVSATNRGSCQMSKFFFSKFTFSLFLKVKDFNNEIFLPGCGL